MCRMKPCSRWCLWSLGRDKWYDPTIYHASDYLSMLGFKLFHVNKRGGRLQVKIHAKTKSLFQVTKPVILIRFCKEDICDEPMILMGDMYWTMQFACQEMCISIIDSIAHIRLVT